MSIYTDLIDAVSSGKKFKVDLVNKSLWIDRKLTIKEGEIVNEQDQGKELISQWDLALNYVIPLDQDVWKVIEILYHDFKHSVPSKNGMYKSYFKALQSEELTDTELAYNADRYSAQCMLEGYILLASLQGWLKWEHGTHWFWKSETDEELVVLRQWIE